MLFTEVPVEDLSSQGKEADEYQVNKTVNVEGLKKSPARQQINGLSNVEGVREVMRTPKEPKNDLTEVRGVRQLMRTPGKLPTDDLSNVSCVASLFTTPAPHDNKEGGPNVRQEVLSESILEAPEEAQKEEPKVQPSTEESEEGEGEEVVETGEQDLETSLNKDKLILIRFLISSASKSIS